MASRANPVHPYLPLGLILLLMGSWLPQGPALADQPDRVQGRAERSSPGLPLGRFRSSGAHQRSHPRVLAAFEEVVRQARRSTVQVLCDGQPAALGAIVAEDGFVLTKASELKGRLECELADGRKLPARLVGVERDFDLAMLQVSARGLPVLPWNTDQPLAAGNWLATPGLKRPPLAVGVVSVLPRPVPSPPGVLGILLGQADQGALVDQIMPGSGAEKAGLQINDVIRGVNGKLVPTREQLIETIRTYRPGDQVQLKVLRGEQQLELSAKLGELAQLAGDRQDFQNTLGGPLSERKNGFPTALQHDTVLKPEHCGGPLVGLDGRAVGINIARAGRIASYALPATAVLPLVERLKSGQLAPDPAPQNLADENIQVDPVSLGKIPQ